MNDPRTCIHGTPRKFGAMGTLPSCTRPQGPCLCGLPAALQGARAPAGRLPHAGAQAEALQGTTTGRMTHSAPHFEELPREWFKLRPPPAGELIDVDYRHAEERVLGLMTTFDESTAFTPEQWAQIKARARA